MQLENMYVDLNDAIYFDDEEHHYRRRTFHEVNDISNAVAGKAKIETIKQSMAAFGNNNEHENQTNTNTNTNNNHNINNNNNNNNNINHSNVISAIELGRYEQLFSEYQSPDSTVPAMPPILTLRTPTVDDIDMNLLINDGDNPITPPDTGYSGNNSMVIFSGVFAATTIAIPQGIDYENNNEFDCSALRGQTIHPTAPTIDATFNFDGINPKLHEFNDIGCIFDNNDVIVSEYDTTPGMFIFIFVFFHFSFFYRTCTCDMKRFCHSKKRFYSFFFFFFSFSSWASCFGFVVSSWRSLFEMFTIIVCNKQT